MHTINSLTKNNLQYLEIENANTKASICLTQGGRLDALIINNNQIIADIHPLTYKDNYASSILFPFVNRIKDGKYSFKETDYILKCNEVEKNNALHGLVYDKPFSLIEKEINSDFALVKLSYFNNGDNIGFPFKFKIDLIYKLQNKGITLEIIINNNDTNTFPFSLGWHPYFKSDNLYNSFLKFDCKKYLAFDKQQIPTKNIDYLEQMPYPIKDNKLDDGYILESNTVTFITPKYDLKITSSEDQNYLQVYTPSQQNIIAIEPMTGIPDCFNNKIGLKTLEPNKTFSIQWEIKIITTK